MENLAYKNAVEAATKRGWHVFPVHTAEHVADDAPVECSCQRPNCTQMGKHPRTRNGLIDATDDLEQLAAWNRQWPDANWAVRTGPESGIWAVDWDGDEGLANRRALIKELQAPLGDTRQVRSGGGGLHDIYAWPADDTVIPNNSKKLASAADVRGKGGYILLPGSGHKSGGIYEVVSDVEPIQAPAYVVTRVVRDTKAAASGSTGATILNGQRNNALASEAGKLRRISFDTPEIDAALQAVNLARCNPPLAHTEVSKIAASIGKYPAGNGTVPSSYRPYRYSQDDGQMPFPSIETEDLMRSDQGTLKVVDFGTAGRPAPPLMGRKASDTSWVHVDAVRHGRQW